MTTDTFTCSMCREEFNFEPGVDGETIKKQYAAEWGIPVETCEIVCDGCWNDFKSRATIYGYDCEWNGSDWVYSDTKEVASITPRPCPMCQKPPTPEGHDACLGNIPGVESACCGHGRENGYIIWNIEGGEHEIS